MDPRYGPLTVSKDCGQRCSQPQGCAPRDVEQGSVRRERRTPPVRTPAHIEQCQLRPQPVPEEPYLEVLELLGAAIAAARQLDHVHVVDVPEVHAPPRAGLAAGWEATAAGPRQPACTRSLLTRCPVALEPLDLPMPHP
eukprot:15440618-Alexandrium_andersonii.AAC.1